MEILFLGLTGGTLLSQVIKIRINNKDIFNKRNDFTLDINSPDAPKIVCLANNPQKQQVYGAVLSLYISRMTKIINQRNKLKSSLIFDEFPIIYFNGIDNLIATARSNKVATAIAVQDYSQLKNEYSRE